MKFVVALLLSAQDPGIEWLDDLDAASRKAAKGNRIVFYRQVLCHCPGTDCEDLRVARDPWFLKDDRARAILRDACVSVARHLPPEREREGLSDPTNRITPVRPPSSKIRSLFLLPNGRILHRLDLCPHAGDIAGELALLFRIRWECFDLDGSVRPGGTELFLKLHQDHLLQPEKWHRDGKIPRAKDCRCEFPEVGHSGGRKPWLGYNRGLLWHTDLDEGAKLARESGKLLLFFQVVGDLHKQGC